MEGLFAGMGAGASGSVRGRVGPGLQGLCGKGAPGLP